LIKSSRYYQTA